MENNKRQTIFMSIIGVATLLVAVIGATFAYFTIQVSGNNTASSIKITTADVAAVTFTDGAAITVTNAYPGYTKSKTFTVKTTSGDSNSQIGYRIQLVTTTTTLSAAATNSKEFNYSLSGTKSGSGTVATAVTKADMPKTNTTTTIGNGVLKGNETHTYTFTVELQERGSAQDYLQGKSFAAKIQIELATTEGNRTWDETTSSWKKYGS
jgi:hypothetical protein